VTDVRGYLRRLETEGMAPNVATLVGHNSILRAVKGDRAGKLTTAQMDKAKQMVRQAMLDGAVGMSTGLIYTPGTYSETDEIIELQKVAEEFGGIYATHMRDEAREILPAIDEALRIGRESGSRVQISHFKMPTDVARTMGGSKVTLARVMEARAVGQEVWLDQYPYTASSTGIATLLPSWVREGGDDKARQILQDPAQLERVLADMRQSHEIDRQRSDMSFAVISSCRAYPQYAGKNVKEVAQMVKLKGRQATAASAGSGADELPEVTPREQYLAIIDIFMKGGASCVFHSCSEEQVENIMRHPLAAVCSDSGIRVFGSGQPHPRGYGSNSRVLGRYVRERGVITLEEAVRKMTSMPALAFRFKDRGLLREGFWADITIFDPETVADQATYEQPHQYAKGIAYVIVNGRPVVENEAVTDALPGMPLYGPGRVEK
jgi:N-acyl-D-amino-acid deacylase